MSTKRIKEPAAKVRKHVLKVACKLSEESHYLLISRVDLIKRSKKHAGSITNALGDMAELRDALVQYAIDNDEFIVVAQAIVDMHPACDKFSVSEKFEYFSQAGFF